MVLMVLGMEGHTLPWPTPPPAPPLRMEVATTTPLRTIPSSLCASPWHHGGQHHNGPTPILVIQMVGPHHAMPCITTSQLATTPLCIPTPWRWGPYGGRAMVLMVLGMEGHTLPWPTPPPASPLRMGPPRPTHVMEYPALSTKVPPTVLVACTIPMAWPEVPPLRSGLSTTHCAGGQVPPSVLVACTIPRAWLAVPPTVRVAKYHPLCWWL